MHQLTEYQGAYLNEKIPVPLNIELKNDRLSIFWGEDVFRRPVTMTDIDEFYLRAEYARIKFERDKTGKIIKSSWVWGDSEPLVFNKRNK